MQTSSPAPHKQLHSSTATRITFSAQQHQHQQQPQLQHQQSRQSIVPRSASSSALIPLSDSNSNSVSSSAPAVFRDRDPSSPTSIMNSRPSRYSRHGPPVDSVNSPSIPIPLPLRRSPHSRTSSCRPASLWLLLLFLICLVAGYKAAQFLLSPSAIESSSAPEAFLHRFPNLAHLHHTRTTMVIPDNATDPLNLFKAIPAIQTQNKDIHNAAIEIPQQLLLSSNTPSTHPTINTLPLVPDRKAEIAHYQMKAEDVPPPFHLSGPTLALNEERIEETSSKSSIVHLPATLVSITSPRSHKSLAIHLNEEGQVGYSLDSAGIPVIYRSFTETSVNFKPCRVSNRDRATGVEIKWKTYRGSSYWRPIPATERRFSYSEYNSIRIYCEGEACRHCPLHVEFRLYEEGMAMRSYAQPSAEDAKAIQADVNIEGDERNYAHVASSIQFALPPDLLAQCWASSQEEPYIKQECAGMLEATMTPITVQLFNNPKIATSSSYALQQRFLAILQADGPAFMRSFGSVVNNYPNIIEVNSKGEAHLSPKEGTLGVLYVEGLGVITPTAWHVLLIGNSPGELLEHNYLIPLLCPPPNSNLPNMLDSRWVGYGKSIRGRGFESLQAQQNTHHLMDWAQLHNYQIVHFDAGWYGNEYNKTETATRVHPNYPDLNMMLIGQHAKASGIKFTVYVNELALRETDQLIHIYHQWGIHGVKFGFVNTLSPRAMRILHERIIAFGSQNLFVNVHDLYRPKGLTRTWPHLVTQEGIRGEERKPTADHHTILPWVRLLQGSADYTPRYLKGSGLLCSRAHQLALPIILHSPIQSLFWAEPASAIEDGVRWYHPELILWDILPTTWDDTRVLAGEIGGFASIARRTGQEWFIGSISNLESTTLHVNLSTLFVDLPSHPRSLLPPPAKGYIVHVYGDAYSPKINTANSGRNGIKVLPRMTYLLPPQLSSDMEVISPIPTLTDYDSASVDHVKLLASQRRDRWLANDQQMRDDKKHFLQPEAEWQHLTSGALAIEMAPSGGHVVYIRPNS